MGGKVVIAAAGGAAHLPEMVASITKAPVIGVPIETKALAGQDCFIFYSTNARWCTGCNSWYG